MDMTSRSREEITKGLNHAKSLQSSFHNNVRILFSPKKITEQNIEDVFDSYSRINRDDYDTVVIVESHPGSAEKKLPMPSFKTVSTPLGDVAANDKLRNDFCDEDDDFFIDDEAFDGDASLYDQLMVLQCTLRDFTVLSIQITDENSFIVKELAYALEEILASRNALLVFCCEMNAENSRELESILSMYQADNMVAMMNYLNSGESTIDGVGTFLAGLIVARKWGLKLNFNTESVQGNRNLLSGYAEMQRQPIFG
jgi:AmmeMemoRadiSam system protein B